MQSIYPSLRYNDAKAAIDWLKSALGFEEQPTPARVARSFTQSLSSPGT
jgi:uncharacterized glyoxalase superfamily protein PhnB